MSLNITKEELEEMYWGEPGTEMGTTLIAQKLDCSQATVYRKLKKYKIPTRPPTWEGTGECLTKKSRNVQRKTIKKLYKESKINNKGDNNPFYNKEHSEENKKKIKKALSNYFKNNDAAFKGKAHTKKAKKKMSKAKKGIYYKNNNPNSKVDKKLGKIIFKEYKNKNINQKELAKKYKLSRPTVNNIVNCKHWTTEHLAE